MSPATRPAVSHRLKPGTQVAYIPTHANGDINHPDVEFGFVTAENRTKDGHHVRYWARNCTGDRLRTTANSENTPNYLLVKYISCPQSSVERELNKINAENSKIGA